MRWWGFLILGMASYLAFLIANIPAHYTLVGLSTAGVPIVASGTSGTLWSGKAEDTRYKSVEFASASWQFRPLSLLQGELKYYLALHNPGQELRGFAAVNVLGSYFLTGIKGIMQAEHLPVLIGQPDIRTTGNLDIDIENLEFAQARIVSARGRVSWLNAGIQTPVSAQLGDLQFDLQGDESALVTDIRDIDGPIKIKGALNLKADGQYRLSGNLKPTAAANPTLANSLSSLGRASADGSIAIEYKGQL